MMSKIYEVTLQTLFLSLDIYSGSLKIYNIAIIAEYSIPDTFKLSRILFFKLPWTVCRPQVPKSTKKGSSSSSRFSAFKSKNFKFTFRPSEDICSKRL